MTKSLRELKNTILDIKPEKPKGFIGFLKQYFRALRFYLVTGLMVWVPLIVTVWLTYWIFRNVGLGIENVMREGYERMNALGERFEFLGFLTGLQYRPGIGFLTTILLFLTTGFFARYLVGRRIINSLETILQRIPFVRSVYKAVQQIRDVFVNREGAVIERVVLIEYPRKGVYAIAFQTNSAKGSVYNSLDKEVIAVFMPTTPNPTTGFLMYVEPNDVIDVNMSVEEAMKLIISGGAYDPAVRGMNDNTLEDEFQAAQIGSI